MWEIRSTSSLHLGLLYQVVRWYCIILLNHHNMSYLLTSVSVLALVLITMVTFIYYWKGDWTVGRNIRVRVQTEWAEIHSFRYIVHISRLISPYRTSPYHPSPFKHRKTQRIIANPSLCCSMAKAFYFFHVTSWLIALIHCDLNRGVLAKL